MTLPTAMPATVLVVEDDPGIAELERGRLEDAGYRAVIVANADDALQEVGKGGLDLVLLDYRLPGGIDGLEFYARVKAAGYDLPVILVTGFSNEATVIQALRVGVRDFVTKSLEYLDYLPEAVARVLRQVGTERRLAESEARLAGVIGSAKDAVIVVEADRRVSLFNAAAEKMFGYSATVALGRPVRDFIPDELAEPVGATDPGSLTHRLQTGSRGVRADGGTFPIEATVSTGRVAGRKFYTLVVRDVTERKRTEEALRASEERFRLLVDGVRDYALIMLDPAGLVMTWNTGAERVKGYAAGEIIGRHFSIFYPKEDRTNGKGERELRTAFETGRFEDEGWRVRKDGARFWAWVSLTPVRDESGTVKGFAKITRDLTERKRLESQLNQSQKMEAIGHLAGGVAHDFNNLLTVINGYSDLLVQQLPPDDPDRELLKEIREAGERAAGLTGQLLAFSRKAVVEPKVLDPNTVVSESGKLLRRLIGADVTLATVLDPEVGRVRADPGQLGQVLMNLAVNARDAMPRGGKLTVETGNVQLEVEAARQHPGLAPGRYVRIAVSDTGCGMTDEVLAHLFEPFFTTKGPGRGTGLGLATTYGIVKQSGGHVEVYSELGVGTTFKVYLPSVNAPPQGPGSDPAGVRGGTESVLLVEDQSDVRRFARLALEAYGYAVTPAKDGLDALRQSADRKVDILVTDVVMPGMSGREVAEALRTLTPGLKVLFMSGYTDDAIVRHGVLAADMAFLQKPYTPLDLARKVRQVLDGNGGSPGGPAQHPKGAGG